jgi:hypothetical protein
VGQRCVSRSLSSRGSLQGRHVARAILERIAGRPAPAYDAKPFTQMGLGLGRNSAMLIKGGWVLPEVIPLYVIAQDYVAGSIRKRFTGSSEF